MARRADPPNGRGRKQVDDLTGLRPLTELVLARLPGPSWLRILVWALVPWLNAAANLALGGDRTSAVWEQSDLLVVLNYLFLSVGVVITLWGSRRIARRLEALRAATPQALAVRNGMFGGVNSVAVPLVASIATALIFGAVALERDGWGSAFLRGVSWFVLGVAFWTFLWTYASLQVETRSPRARAPTCRCTPRGPDSPATWLTSRLIRRLPVPRSMSCETLRPRSTPVRLSRSCSSRRPFRCTSHVALRHTDDGGRTSARPCSRHSRGARLASGFGALGMQIRQP